MRTKLWILGAALSLLAATPASALKVYKVTSEGLADVKVYETNSEGLADCIIHVETSEGLAKGNARWYYESSEGLADVNMYFTDSAGLADKKVYFTTSAGLAKCDVEWENYKKRGAAPPRLEPERLAHSGVVEDHEPSSVQGRQEYWRNAVAESKDSAGKMYLHFHLRVRTDARKTLSMTPTANNSMHRSAGQQRVSQLASPGYS